MELAPRDYATRPRRLTHGRQTTLTFLPPYSPDFNRIEHAFAKLKTLLRKAAARTSITFGASSASLDAFMPTECADYFADAGNDAY